MKVILICVMIIIFINVSSDRNAPLYSLINLADYFDSNYNKSILVINHIDIGNKNVILNNYNYTKDFMICNKSTTGYVNLNSCQKPELKTFSENKFIVDRNKNKIYYVFENQNALVRIFVEDYIYPLSLSIDSSICFDFFGSHNNLKISLNNNINTNTFLYLQYRSNSTEVSSKIKLSKSETIFFDKSVTSLNFTQKIEPNSYILFEFSPPNISSKYCLYSLDNENSSIYVDNFTKTAPIIYPQKYRFYSIFDKKEYNFEENIYNITYFFKFKNAKLNYCLGYKKYNIYERYNCSSVKKIDDEHYKISYQMDSKENYSFFELELEAYDLFNYNNYFDNFIKFYRTVEDQEYLSELLSDFSLGLFISTLASIMIILFLYRCGKEYC